MNVSKMGCGGSMSWVDNVPLFIGLISLVLASYTHVKISSKYVDVRYGYSTYDAGASFNTQFSFSNVGTIPATEVKIGLTYPAATKILRVVPAMKYIESEDELEKHIELEIQRLDVEMPLGVLVTSSHAPKTTPKIQFHEQKSVQTAARARIMGRKSN